MEKIKIEIDKINKMLRNSKFIKNAPDEVVKKQKENFMNYKNTLTKLEEAKKNIPTRSEEHTSELQSTSLSRMPSSA